MKISPIQLVASVTGAVVAAVIASFFGVSGTIVGVAVGSAVATLGTAVAAHSIERTHQAVRRVVDQAGPAGKRFVRRTGTGVAGVGAEEPTAAAGDVAAFDPAGPVVVPVGSDAAETEMAHLAAAARTAGGTVTGGARHAVGRGVDDARRTRWPIVVVSGVAVFLAALLLVTFIELGAGRSLANLLGHPGGRSTTVGNVVNPAPPSTTVPLPAPTTVPPVTTTTTVPGATTTTKPPGTPTTVKSPTTTNAPATTTTSPAPPTTSGAGAETTTPTAPSGPPTP